MLPHIVAALVAYVLLYQETPPEVISDEFVTGPKSTKTQRNITRLLNRLLKEHSHCKIGKTGCAIIRADQDDYRGEYRKMFLLYRSTSPANIAHYESYYISRFYQQLNNIDRHSAGKMRSYDGYYYLYLVASN